jgi:hypothetical protein
MAHRDAAAIKAPWSPGGVLVMLQEAVLSQLIVEYWANRVATSGTTHIEERIDNPQIPIDHDLAMVWAPFDFYIDGKLDHCGRDLFNLTRNRSGWQIVALAATTPKGLHGELAQMPKFSNQQHLGCRLSVVGECIRGNRHRLMGRNPGRQTSAQPRQRSSPSEAAQSEGAEILESCFSQCS